ncbi:hypothetical protein H257_11031 [Aphanomyces astaci]|uniref:Uncharacterized protein n=1 Tax=Aphanomyces astaci TaxID=112090 RepID=W4G5D0_APHAT|nr:hypothetical protein H257_11031 [Aphanomyces astaci]ETV74496.1 hypothetical protein H257_11031 [Aphanomyces astaci]|eukprot:XP_009836154.1 hypothetical protein H257_11031 [Aphanomyces astaci]
MTFLPFSQCDGDNHAPLWPEPPRDARVDRAYAACVPAHLPALHHGSARRQPDPRPRAERAVGQPRQVRVAGRALGRPRRQGAEQRHVVWGRRQQGRVGMHGGRPIDARDRGHGGVARGAAVAAALVRRVHVRVHGPRPLRPAQALPSRRRRHHRQRRDRLAPRRHRARVRPGRRAHGVSIRYDGQPHRRDPRDAQRARVRAREHHGVHVQEGIVHVRAVPRRGRVDVQGRPPAVPAPRGQPLARAAGVRPRRGRRSRHGDRQAESVLHRHRPGAERQEARARGVLRRVGRVQDAQGLRRLDGLHGRRGAGGPLESRARRRQHPHHVLYAVHPEPRRRLVIKV